MKILKRIFTVVSILIAAVIVGGLLYLNRLKTRAIPDFNEVVEILQLEDEVTVYRDSLGIPHIYASNDMDLYRVVGYVMAQDRLWQMDLMRRITMGRLSEVLDPSLVDTDQLFRALNIPEKSERIMAVTDPQILACAEAYSDGINQFIEHHQRKLPVEFALLGYKPEPWEPIHSFYLAGYMAWDLKWGWGQEIALYKMNQVLSDTLITELLPDQKYQSTPVFPGFKLEEGYPDLASFLDNGIEVIRSMGLQVFEASNNWAVSGAKSETGFPLMANDMHLGLMAPGIWYQMHQVVEGKMNVTGVALPGAPFIICGHNEDIAWGMTNVMVDDIDFYLETINPADSNQYLLDGRWMDMRLVEEKIWVNGKKEPETRVNRYTHRGPVVSRFRDLDNHIMSARWQGRESSNEIRTIYLLNRAANWEQFRDAVRTFNSISQNIVYADRAGNIGLQTAAGIPIREESGILVYPGDTSAYDWKGIIPFDELPFVFNPESGHVSSANNITVGEEYPTYIGAWFSLPSRIDRIRQMLEEKEKLGSDDFRRMLRDQTSPFAEDFTTVYLEALPQNLQGKYGESRHILEGWDYNLQVTSPAALIFEMMWQQLIQAIFYDELGEELYPLLIQNNILAGNLINRIRITGTSLWCDDITTLEEKESFSDNILRAFRLTVDTLTTLCGEDPASWEWGMLHKVTIMHPLGSVRLVEKLFKVNRGPYPIGGSDHTVCPYGYPVGQSFVSNFGASERHIFNTANWDQSLTVIPTGTSGIPASPHYMDQTPLYLANKYHRDLFFREAVASSARYKAIYR